LTHIDNVSLYKLEVENPSTLEYSGVPVNVRLNTYELTDGWNWISFAPQEAQEINYALADLENGAAIKSQVESAIYYEGVGWYGSMTMLEPLQGYLINMNAPEQFNFPEPVADSGNVAIDHIEIPEPDDEDNGNIAELDKEDIGIEVIFANKENDIINDFVYIEELKIINNNDKIVTFSCNISSSMVGVYNFVFRIFPKHELLPHRQDFPLIKWV